MSCSKKEDVGTLLPIVEPDGTEITKQSSDDLGNQNSLVLEQDIPIDIKTLIHDICKLKRNIKSLNGRSNKKEELDKLKTNLAEKQKTLDAKKKFLSSAALTAVNCYARDCATESVNLSQNIPSDIKSLIDGIAKTKKNIKELSKKQDKKLDVLKLKSELLQKEKELNNKKKLLSDRALTTINCYARDCVTEAESYDKNTVDFKRGRLEELKKELLDVKQSEKSETRDKKINNLETSIDKLTKEIASIEKGLSNLKESVVVTTEARQMEKEIEPIVNMLNKKGYKVKYASPGHPGIRKKGDRDKDGVYYGKFYSDARIMFDSEYHFPPAPEGWHWRVVDNCSYLDVTPVDPKDKSQSDPNKWKDNYMKSLKDYVDSLPDEKDSTSEEDVKESTSIDVLYDTIMESAIANINFGISNINIDTSDCIQENKMTSELDKLFGID